MVTSEDSCHKGTRTGERQCIDSLTLYNNCSMHRSMIGRTDEICRQLRLNVRVGTRGLNP